MLARGGHVFVCVVWMRTFISHNAWHFNALCFTCIFFFSAHILYHKVGRISLILNNCFSSDTAKVKIEVCFNLPDICHLMTNTCCSLVLSYHHEW